MNRGDTSSITQDTLIISISLPKIEGEMSMTIIEVKWAVTRWGYLSFSIVLSNDGQSRLNCYSLKLKKKNSMINIELEIDRWSSTDKNDVVICILKSIEKITIFFMINWNSLNYHQDNQLTFSSTNEFSILLSILTLTNYFLFKEISNCKYIQSSQRNKRDRFLAELIITMKERRRKKPESYHTE